MTKPQARIARVLNALSPIINCLTGVTIMLVGIVTIAFIGQNVTLRWAWTYHAVVLCIVITVNWWGIYFLHRGITGLWAPKERRDRK